ncbi:MAG: hypothetical protein NZM38_02150 [Cytophagales bacterium]|nr:hypothetical protein [Cytophagales bacterium]MDW8383554.1 hypothetical protein [Flammeovirgaceae bacterium]
MNKFKLSNQQANQTVQTIGSSVIENLQQELLKGNLAQLTSLFTDKNLSTSQIAENPVVKTLISTAVTALSSKIGLSAAVAQPVAALVVPKVIEMIKGQSKTNNIADIINSLGCTDVISKGIAGGISDSLKKGLGGFFK